MTRILVVEDDRVHRKIIREILAPHGYDVMEAADGIEAIHMQRDHGFDLILTDVVMPGVSGGDLAKQLKQAMPSLKVVFMSGYNDDEVMRHGVSSNETAFLQKPFTRDLLVKRIEEAMH